MTSNPVQDYEDRSKCNLFVEELLQHEELRNEDLCRYCARGVGGHARITKGYRNTSSSLDEDFHIDSDCQNQNMDIKKEDLPKANKDASIFPSEKDKQSKPPHSLGSRSTSSSSIKSSDVQGANIRISVASMSTDSETSKKASAIERGLQRAALVEAALLRTKKVTLFFAKYCAGQVGTDSAALYELVLESLKHDHQRLYLLTQHARHNALGHFQFMNTAEAVVKFFELLNEVMPLDEK